MIRTRAITDKLSYDDLLNKGLIPDIFSLISQSMPTATKRYPPFVYKNKEYAMFGLIMDYVIRAGLRINLTQPVELGTDPVAHIILSLDDNDLVAAIQILNKYETSKNINDIMSASLELSSIMLGDTKFTHSVLSKYVPTTVNIIKEIIAKWNSLQPYLDGTVMFNTEYTSGYLEGHPDIITSSAILDIKNTCSFLKMAKESSLQVLAYYAIMKKTNPDIKYVGFVLPMQRDICIYDVSNWDSSLYLDFLMHEADILYNKPDPVVQLLDQILSINVTKQIGFHTSKGRNIATSLENYALQYPNLPCQMFLANPRSGKRNKQTSAQIEKAFNVIKEYGIPYYTHAPYVINLCANACNDKGEYWQQQILNDDLAYTVAMGGRGVVVHTGSKKKLPEHTAIAVMEQMVRSALPYATETCPLLLETPCSEGTEVVSKIEELGQFFFRFTNEERQKLGVCIDSCHVFSAGYDPLLYLQHWEKHCQTPIKLVHFNDSATPCGSRVDKHATPGTGHIGMEKMQSIYDWCIERNIPMIQE